MTERASTRSILGRSHQTHLQGETPGEIPCVIMDAASGSQRAAGDEHGGSVDTELGEKASV